MIWAILIALSVLAAGLLAYALWPWASQRQPRLVYRGLVAALAAAVLVGPSLAYRLSQPAPAVEQQSAATNEISRNVQEAAQGTEAVTTNIAGVAEAARETGSAASQVLGAATGLGEQASDLRSAVESFVARVRAA